MLLKMYNPLNVFQCMKNLPAKFEVSKSKRSLFINQMSMTTDGQTDMWTVIYPNLNKSVS